MVSLKRLTVFGLLFVTFLFAFNTLAFTGPTCAPGDFGCGGSLQLDASGNIGVGTSSSTPVSTFNTTSTESGLNTFGRVFMVASTTNPGIGLKNLTPTTGNTYIWSSRGFGNLQLYRESSVYPGLVVIDINRFGDVAIGTSTPSTGASSKLAVSGDIKASAVNATLTGGVVAGNVNSGVFSSGNFAFQNALGVGTTSLVGLPTNGLLVTGTTTLATTAGSVGVGILSPIAKLDVTQTNGAWALIIGADVNGNNTRTNATRKFSRFGMPHYTNSEEPVTLLTGDSDGTNNYVSIGGPTTSGNAPTVIRFFTATNSTTVTGSERMRIDSVGNVGIGTSTPATKLHIYDAASPVFTIESDWAAGDYGAIRFASVAQSGYQAEIASYAPGDSTRDLRFYTSNSSKTERVRILGNGNFGINTTNPSSRLHVVGSTTITDDLYLTNNKSIRLDGAASTTLLIANYNSGGFSYGLPTGSVASLAVEGDVKGNRLCFGDTDCQTSWTGIVASGGGNYWGQSGSYLYASSTSWSVGIGTTAPADLLDVHKATPGGFGGRITVSNTAAIATGNVADIGFKTSGNDVAGYYAARIAAISPNALTRSDLAFYLYDGGTGTGTEKMRILNNGNVGIGTSTPLARLDIQQAQNTDAATFTGAHLKLSDSGTTNSGGTTAIALATSIVDNYGVSLAGLRAGVDGTPSFAIRMHNNSASGIEVIRIDNTGNVGIGTSTPATELHVYSASGNAATFNQPITIGYPSVSTDAARKDYVDNNFALSSGASGVWKLSGSNIYASSTAYNVAVGTTTPLAKMDIVGSLSTSSAQPILVLARPYNAGIAWGSSASFKLANPNSGNDNTRLDIALDDAGANPYQLPGTTVMSLMSNGNVGIGTTTPTMNLQVSSATVGSGARSGVSNLDGTNFLYLWPGFSGTSNDAALVWDSVGDLRLGTESTVGNGFSEKMRIKTGGSIGIGTTTPATLTHLYKSSGDSILSIENTGNGNTSGIDFIRERSTGMGVNGGSIFIDSNTGSTESLLYIQAQSASANAGNTAALSAANGVRLLLRGGSGIFSIESGATESFRIIANGNTGIGVTDPGAAKLRVEGNTIVNGNINQLVATSYNYMVAPLSVGSASSPGTSALYVNGFSNLALGAKVGSVAGGWLYYPNVLSYMTSITSPGAIILNTNIGRASNEMFKIRVLGYGYGDSSNIDFTVVGYAYSAQNGSVDGLAGAIVNYSVVDNGNDGLTKRIGVNSAGNVAVAVGDTTSSFYFYRMSVDYWSTRNAVDASSGWSFSTSTTAGFGFLDNKTLSPAITQFTDGTVGIGTNTDSAYKLYTNGTSYFNGQVTLAAAQQLTWSATNANNKIDLAGGDLTGVDKISAATVDPLYEIEGAKYSTYAPSIAGGVKEEYIGRAKLKKYTGKFYEYILDLEKEKKGSDLWVWFKAVDFSKDSIQATITPIGEPASVAYEIKDNSIIFRGSSATEFSFRLTGKRFDWREHPTYAKDQQESPNLIIK